jgi:hypothetical protein
VKPSRDMILLFALGFSAALPAFAQSNGQPPAQAPADIIRQLRERQMAKTDAAEMAGKKEAEFHANILIVDSKSVIEKWVLLPAAERAKSGRFHQVPTGKKFFFPFVVTDYPYPATEKTDLSAHIRVLSPAGRVLLDQPAYSQTVTADPRSPHTIVLNPVMDITFDPKDTPGVYTFRLTVVDRVHATYSKAEEKLEIVPPSKESGETVKTPAAVAPSEAH